VGSVYIWWSALRGIRRGDFTADIPVSVATAAAIAIGQFSAAAVVAVLLLLGGMLESFVSRRAEGALEALASLLPDRVTIRRDERDLVVPLEQVQTGDLLLIRSGEKIAADGQIVSGTASVNQAAITGESMPVEKHAGDGVCAGTFLEFGALEVRVLKLGEETTLGQIKRMIVQAQEEKPPIERLLNRYAKLYTPAALVIGALLWWLSGDLLKAITVLIVFCPCVMVIATPTALVASIGNAALRGSLVKKGATIEAMAKVDTVAFDKTGTLTFGRLRLMDILPLNGIASDELLRVAAAAEKFSEHPIGRALVQAAEERSLPVVNPQSFEVLPGQGVRASLPEGEIILGRTAAMTAYRVDVASGVMEQSASLAEQGRSVVCVAINEKVAGLLVFEDELRPEAKAAVRGMNRLGLRTVLISGDNEVVAALAAANLRIKELYADVLPGQKLLIVKCLQSDGRKVAFVGDGVNDGPALAAADVGIAMGRAGTDVAIETAEIALLSDDLSKLTHLIVLSRQAITVIQQNLAFSIGVLAVALGLTFAGFLSPVTGALLHELSSIPVIANSARLIRAKERE
jgi:Cd2+/Zn2+-exporting ATPase